MIIVAHSLVGAVAATKTDSLVVAFLLGMVTHFILDAIPHLDPGTIINPFGKEDIKWPKIVYVIVLLDFIVTAVIFYFFKYRSDFSLMIWGALGAISIDIIENFPFKFVKNLPILRQIQWLHRKAHFWLPTEKWYWGAFTSTIVIGGMIWYLLKF